jgi:arginase family enzyme
MLEGGASSPSRQHEERPVSKDYPTLFGCEQGAGGHVVVIGLPYDRGTAPEHAGCAAAPQAVRRLSAPEVLRVKQGAIYDLARREIIFPGSVISDLGDLKYRPNQSDDDYLEFVTHAISLVAREGKRPLVLGGDHLVTLPVLRGLARAGRRVQIVQLDAHHDFDVIERGERPTHATFVSYIVAEELAEKVLQIGIRGLSWGVPPMPEGVACVKLSELGDALLPGVDVYLTVDTDAFDPSVAPAVQYPEPGGLTLSALGEVLAIFREKGLRGAGADWTEYSPALDPANCLTGRFILHGLAHIVRYLSEEPA